ncbi:uncharacterized protein [Nicotiana sylvestris]|uniref:uncharacterized protein n=1 Tax=Nicotiana sylvestris TaxID=4096 RepID=UPI00388C4CB2
MREVCQHFKIPHRNPTPYRPKANGAVEAANKNIKKILRKMVEGYRQWHEILPFALLGYRTTVRTSVGTTPYLLVYRTEAAIPAEVEIPSLRIVAEVGIDDDEWVKARLEQLNLIDEKRLAAVCHGQLYQKRMARAYNKKLGSCLGFKDLIALGFVAADCFFSVVAVCCECYYSTDHSLPSFGSPNTRYTTDTLSM